jgi:uncharacterized protein (TIGR02808 family)
MSTLESVIWHTLGYIAIPIVLLVGIGISTLLFFLLVNLFGSGGDEE